jgi:hypothetical protein
MATGQKLRGFVGQGMNGLRKAKSPLSYVYPPGSYTLTVTKPGWYRFVLWGSGGYASAAISSGGALVIADRRLGAGQAVSIVVGSGEVAGVNSVITFPDGSSVTAARGAEGATAAGGVATGNTQLGDTLVNGGAAGGGVPGVAASSGTYRGGTSVNSLSPGNGASPTRPGGDGLCIVHQTRLRP